MSMAYVPGWTGGGWFPLRPSVTVVTGPYLFSGVPPSGGAVAAQEVLPGILQQQQVRGGQADAAALRPSSSSPRRALHDPLLGLDLKSSQPCPTVD